MRLTDQSELSMRLTDQSELSIGGAFCVKHAPSVIQGGFKKIDQFKLNPNNIEMFTKRYMYIGGVVMENSKISIFLNPSLCPIYRDILHLRHDIRDPQVTVIIPDIEAAWEQLLTQSFVIKIVKPKSKS